MDNGTEKKVYHKDGCTGLVVDQFGNESPHFFTFFTADELVQFLNNLV